MPIIYDDKYPNGFIEVEHINPYLMNAPDIFVEPRPTPFFNVPRMIAGNRPTDNRNFLLTCAEMEDFIKKEPRAEKFIRQCISGKDFIHGTPRYCLYLVDCAPDELRKMPLVYQRVKNVREFRLKSKNVATRKAADKPTLFQRIVQPSTNYIFIPQVSSERRKYIPIGFMSPEIICLDPNFMVPDADLFLFGMLTSSVHMAWVRMVCGRLRADYRYSNTICYNCFPFPLFYRDEWKSRVEISAQKILDARKNYPNASYADLYDEISMPSDLRKAHELNDAAAMSLYGRLKPDMDEETLQVKLLQMYADLREHFGEGEEFEE